jgi:glycosyltransferase involved in cell wall biosynthesis
VREFVLHICDDCSTDSSWAVIERYAQKHPKKIKARQNSENSGGAKWNFMRMMIAHKDDYVMLSDQDDVWLPTKSKRRSENVHAGKPLGSTARRHSCTPTSAWSTETSRFSPRRTGR